MSFARRGQPANAIGRLVGPMLAPGSAEVETIVRSKFIDPPEHQVCVKTSRCADGQ